MKTRRYAKRIIPAVLNKIPINATLIVGKRSIFKRNPVIGGIPAILRNRMGYSLHPKKKIGAVMSIYVT